MGSLKPVSGEAALQPLKAPAATAKEAPGTKPPLTTAAGNAPVPSKIQLVPSPSFTPSSPSPGANLQELYQETAIRLGLPQDTLSFVLISAIRYFSLPPEAALLSRLRGELLAAGAGSAPKSGREKAALEARALAAASAADKGLRLSPEALEEYAAAMEPAAWFSGGRGRQGSPEDREPPGREETPDGEELEKLYREANREKGGKEGLLSWLNRFPGGNGQGWAVFPFKIKVGSVELKVSVRLLIKERSFVASGRKDGYLIVDIEGPAHSWRFILDRSGGAQSVLDITVCPGQAEDIKALEKEAGKFFAGPGTEIRVRKGDEASFFTDQLCQEALPSINEEV
jgi:hypothetical protein